MLAHVRSRQKSHRDDELVTCPKCDAEVDVEEDEATAQEAAQRVLTLVDLIRPHVEAVD
jgi:hypothetical protein